MTVIRTLREDVEELRERVGELERELSDVRSDLSDLQGSSPGASVSANSDGLGCLVMIALVALIVWVFFK